MMDIIKVMDVTENMVVTEVIDVMDTSLCAPLVWNHTIVFMSSRIVGAAWRHPKAVVVAMHSCQSSLCVS